MPADVTGVVVSQHDGGGAFAHEFAVHLEALAHRRDDLHAVSAEVAERMYVNARPVGSSAATGSVLTALVSGRV
ncbi:hypothetical protein GCM10023086_58640 [Streptomyces venetus]|uniref:Uncharacterized protein n=1 Tax=Streptomyces venetus TaxID=1701086 RepID=A0ABP8GSU6_9ACTN